MKTYSLDTDNAFRINRNVYLFIIFLFLYLIAALRPFSVGTDTIDYMQGFINQRTSIQSRNIGYNSISGFLHYFSNDPRFFLIIITLLIQLPIYYSVYKFTKFPVFGILVYGLLFYGHSLNILRQFLVISLFYSFGIDFLLKRKLIYFLIFTAILVTIHELAILFLPLYFISRKLFSLKLYLIVWFVSFLFLLSNQISAVSSLFQQLDMFLRVYFASLPQYLLQVEERIRSDVSLNGAFLDQGVFLYAIYHFFFLRNKQLNETSIIFFDIFFVGIIMQNLFIYIDVIQRVSLLFLFAITYVAANVIYPLKYRLLLLLVLGALFYVRFVLNGISGVFH